MAKKIKPVPRRLTPREALRRFYQPRPTRRQLLGSFVAGVATIGCSGSEQPSNGGGAVATPATAPELGPQPSPVAGQAGAPGQAPGVTVPAEPMGEPSPVGDVPQPGTEPALVDPMDPTTEPVASSPLAPTEPATPPVVQPQPAETMEMTEPQAPMVEAPSEPMPTTPMGRTAFDLVELGSTGIVTSRLAMGSGTNGVDGTSVQTRMAEQFTNLLVQGFDRGIRFFETADAYGAHPFVAEAMRQVGRQNVTVLTKTMAETREEAEADLSRFLEELDTDYIDIVLLHIRESATWVSESEGAMEVLAEAKARGQIRAHGVSCHTLAALELAARTDWVDLDQARINPFQLHMDADPDTVRSVLDGMKASGKAVIGMKILGQGDAVDRFDEAIEHATRLDCIHAFTMGFRSIEELDQVASKIASTTLG